MDLSLSAASASSRLFPHPGLRWISRNNSFSLARGRGYGLEVYPPTKGNIQMLDFDHDNFWRPTDKALIKINSVRHQSLSDWQATGANPHGISVLPEFNNPASGDFSLPSRSPLRDAGLRIPGINDNFRGRAPDIGA